VSLFTPVCLIVSLLAVPLVCRFVVRSWSVHLLNMLCLTRLLSSIIRFAFL